MGKASQYTELLRVVLCKIFAWLALSASAGTALKVVEPRLVEQHVTAVDARILRRVSCLSRSTGMVSYI